MNLEDHNFLPVYSYRAFILGTQTFIRAFCSSNFIDDIRKGVRRIIDPESVQTSEMTRKETSVITHHHNKNNTFLAFLQ